MTFKTDLNNIIKEYEKQNLDYFSKDTKGESFEPAYLGLLVLHALQQSIEKVGGEKIKKIKITVIGRKFCSETPPFDVSQETWNFFKESIKKCTYISSLHLLIISYESDHLVINLGRDGSFVVEERQQKFLEDRVEKEVLSELRWEIGRKFTDLRSPNQLQKIMGIGDSVLDNASRIYVEKKLISDLTLIAKNHGKTYNFERDGFEDYTDRRFSNEIQVVKAGDGKKVDESQLNNTVVCTNLGGEHARYSFCIVSNQAGPQMKIVGTSRLFAIYIGSHAPLEEIEVETKRDLKIEGEDAEIIRDLFKKNGISTQNIVPAKVTVSCFKSENSDILVPGATLKGLGE